ncbi:tetratricopeptide repeat protein [Sphingomonas sp.]|uniref:tetratricopeptide repeat protein n=1 Tax=Sphingomonas sp. TaxID=28214 RepID=UPI003B00BDFE
MGWLTLFLIGGAAFAALVVLGLRRPLWSLAGAALMIGATGYALQGSPALPGQAPRADLTTDPADPGLIALRDQMLGHWTAQGAYVVAADAMTRIGEKRAAVQAVLGGIRRYPDNLLLWVALGNTLVAHDGDRVSPPSLFAFRQALRLGPEHPAPYFFLGLAHIRAGEFAAARPLWARAVALSPAGTGYRVQIAARLVLLDTYLAQAGR